MISWMQKHRKYLVVTIWISTIAFVGAGFVGWGTYQYGKKSNSVALVGDVPVTLEEFQHAYANTYEQVNRAMGGRLDEATAKRLGLRKQVLNSLIYQALILNLANEYGIVVSDEEVQKEILSIEAFQKEGKFDKQTYLAVLRNMRMKPKAFEASLKKEMLVQKTLSFLDLPAVETEVKSLASALFMADKIRYKIFDAESINVDINNTALHAFWEKRKNDYLTPRRYELALVWIEAAGVTPAREEIETYYREHRTDFTNEEGAILPLEKAKEKVLEALRLKKAKKSAQLAYIELKKGKRAADENRTLDENDPLLSAETWKAIEGAETGGVLKPKVVNGKYVVVKVLKKVEPHPKSFEEARLEAMRDYVDEIRKERVTQMAKEAVKSLDDAPTSDFLTRDSVDRLKGLTPMEAREFLARLFEAKKPEGWVLLGEKAVAYKIVEQKLLDVDKLTQHEDLVRENARKIKSDLLRNGLIARLQQKYPIQIYLKESE